MMRRILISLLLLLTVAQVACTPLSYYFQSARGQLDLLSRREPIVELVADSNTSAALRTRLQAVLEMREFASATLALPDNGSYRSYADLGRNYVVWNVFAAPELSVEPRTWCFPVVGCLAYRGYFDEQKAKGYAARIDSDYDVYVAGVVAYSTLGHFDDPVLNTMLRGDDIYLAGVLFHELAHQLIYIRGDTSFNEAFASLVEEEGVRRWLESRNDQASWTEWQQRQHRREAFAEMVDDARERLRELYESDLADEQKRRAKLDVITGLRGAHEQLRQAAGGTSGFEQWFDGPLNNAQLASVATYRRLVPAFRTLLDDKQGDIREFYAAARALSKLPEETRHQRMEHLLSRSNSGQMGTTAEVVETTATELVLHQARD